LTDETREAKELMSRINDILIDTEEKLHKPFERMGFDEAFFDVSISLVVKVGIYEVRVCREDKRIGSGEDD